jgi:hypothetical protein
VRNYDTDDKCCKVRLVLTEYEPTISLILGTGRRRKVVFEPPKPTVVIGLAVEMLREMGTTSAGSSLRIPGCPSGERK